MADEDTREDAEETEDEETEEDGVEGEEAADEDVPDPFEGLQRIAEELQPAEDGASGQAARVRAIADGLREKLTACQAALGTEEPAGSAGVIDTLRALLDAQLFMQEELSETFMPYLTGLSAATRDNVADIRDWGDEIESLVDQGGVGDGDADDEGSILVPNDGKAIDTLLGELQFVLSSHVKDMDANSDQRKAVEIRLGQIATMRKHVKDITLPDEATQA